MSARALVAALCAIASAAVPAAVAAGASTHPPARVLVYAQEWALWPSRPSVHGGRVIVQLWNRGQDPHDLRIRRLDRRGRMTGQAQGLAVTDSGAIGEASWRLGPGRYELYCSMPGHLQYGMHTRLLVK